MFTCPAVTLCGDRTLKSKERDRQRDRQRNRNRVRDRYRIFDVTNEEVCAKIQQAIGPREDLLTIV